MKNSLTEKEIQFIENYLDNSGVQFIDVRLEMVDHVASAVEDKMETNRLDFYDAFKEYMVKHKKQLLKNANKFHWSVGKAMLIQVGKNLFNRYIFASFLLIFICYSFFSDLVISGIDDFKFALPLILFVIVFSIPLCYLLYNKIGKLSTVNQLVAMGYFGNVLFLRWIDNLVEGNFILTSISLLICCWVNLSIAKTTYDCLRRFNNFQKA